MGNFIVYNIKSFILIIFTIKKIISKNNLNKKPKNSLHYMENIVEN